jgi:predicted nucleic acid-binding protein
MTDNPEYQFIDTNVLVYAHDISAGSKNVRAKQLLQGFWESQTGCLSVQVLQEFYVVVTRKVSKPLDIQIARDIIADLSYWRVHSPTPEDVLSAIDLQGRYQLAFWDAMIIRSAKKLGCQRIWSEDMNPGQMYDGIEITNPFE